MNKFVFFLLIWFKILLKHDLYTKIIYIEVEPHDSIHRFVK